MIDLWNERFQSEEYVYGEEPNQFFKKSIEKLTPGKILLLADGEGRNAVFAAKLGWNVDAVDYSEAAKEKAIKLAEKNGVKINYQIADLNEYIIEDEKYDCIVLVFAHFDEKLRAKVHINVNKALKHGGHVIIEGYEKGQISKLSGGPKNLDLLYSLEDIYTEFQDLDFLEFSKKTIILNEGSLHKGEAEVVRLFAKK